MPPPCDPTRLTQSPAAAAAAGWRVALILVAIGSLILAPGGPGQLPHPEVGRVAERGRDPQPLQDHPYIAAVVFVVVEGALVYSVFKFRAKKGAVAAQIHGNTRLEIGWTVGAALILVVLTVVTFIKLPSDPQPAEHERGRILSASLTQPTPPNGKVLTICVKGRQFIWRYTYGTGCNNDAFDPKLPYSYQEMVVPANTTVDLTIQSTDVIHSWWVPSLGGKVDAVPGYTTYTWFKAPHAGSLYHGQCAQLCGRQHARMTALVKVVTPPQYSAWLETSSNAIASGQRPGDRSCARS